ncbi:hypothetical protein [Corynebacterium sp. sy039]|uniref:hypothetical protein n=1 Tax=Corynebacterium sp. sy039 TaxID=2599641 RepID=UPI0011B832CB|nr:hypothetical protein [Corynebacterium sp. sy039]QDZ43206.1 hypothetical protein FQV43_08600 [Corynebacterium sp. sy039]
MLIGSFNFALAVLCSAIVWFSWRRSGQKEGATAVSESYEPGVVRQSFKGFRFILGHDFLKRLTFTSFHFNFFSSIFQAGFVVYCVRVLGFGGWEMGVVGVLGALGGLLGAVVAATEFAVQNAKNLYMAAITAPALSVFIMLLAQLASAD